MGHNPDGSISIRTLGDLAESEMNLTAYCENQKCRRTLGVTVPRLIAQFGADWPFILKKPPIKCAACGSNEISYTMSPSDTSGQPKR